jgi:hypothetical protein
VPSTAPPVSMTICAPRAARRRARRSHRPASVPGQAAGQLAPVARGDGGVQALAQRLLGGLQGLGARARPGRLMSVLSPRSATASLMLVRVAPGRRSMPSVMPRSAKAARKTRRCRRPASRWRSPAGPGRPAPRPRRCPCRRPRSARPGRGAPRRAAGGPAAPSGRWPGSG